MISETQAHFTKIASQYADLRTTDIQPVRVIQQQLDGIPHITAADVGCGTGRYDLKIVQCLGDRLTLACMDSNRDMLRQLRQNLLSHGAQNFHTVEGTAEHLPFRTRSLDILFTFNAIHIIPHPEFFDRCVPGLES